MTGQEHAAEAERLLIRVTRSGGDVDPNDAPTVAAAQVHATLAVAAEQRTANLIAVSATAGSAVASMLGAEILARLGLDGAA